MKKFPVFLVLGFVVLSGLAAQSGRVLYVSVRAAEIKSATGFFAGVLGTLPFGEAVTVLQEQEKWVRVQSRSRPSLSGWMALTSLTSKRVVSAGSAATAGELALAGKGLNFSAELERAYQREYGISYEIINNMERQNIPSRDLYNFLVEGRLQKGE